MDRTPAGDTRSEVSADDVGAVVQARDVTGGVHFHPRQRSRRPPRQLPGAVNGFVDRSPDLRLLDRTLDENRRNPVVLVVGTAGVGKTSLILHWGHTRRDRFPDGELYADLHGHSHEPPVTSLRVLEGFLTALGVPRASIPWGLGERAALYRTHLADRRMLIVLDNAATAAQVRPLLPGTPGCMTLVTSRVMLAGLVARDGARRVSLNRLADADAVSLLREAGRGYRTDDPEHLAELAGMCAGLPLALRIAAERAIARPRTPLDEMISELRSEPGLWETLTSEDDPEDGEAQRAIFTWSYRALPPETARLFRSSSLHAGPEFGSAVAGALAGVGVPAAKRALDALADAHLLERGPADRYQFHDLLRSYAMDRSRHEDTAEERRASVRRMLSWYLYTAASAQTWINPQERSIPLPLAEQGVQPLDFDSYDSAVHWYERERANLVSATRTAAENELPEHAWKLSVVLRNIYMRFNPFDDWLTTSRIGLESARRAGDRSGEADLLESLGMAYTQSHELEKGAESHGAALMIRREAGDSEGEALSLNDLGLVYLRSRRLREARAMFEQGMVVYRELDDAHWEAVLAANLGEAHAELEEYDGAESMVRHALSLFHERADHGGEGNALRLLSMIRRGRADVSGALDAATRSVEIAREFANPMWEGYWLLELARAQRMEGDAEAALRGCQRATVLHGRVGDQARTALSWDATGEAYQDLDRMAAAELCHTMAVRVFRGQRENGWPLAVALDNLANSIAAQDRLPQARDHWTEAREILTAFEDPKAESLRRRIGDLLRSL